MIKFTQGDIISLDFNPQKGHEQQGRRPAIVLSNNMYNSTSVMVLVAPITHTDKNHPYHIKLKGTEKVDGTILCDQFRTLDVKARNGSFIEKAPDEITEEVLELIKAFM